MLQCTLPEANGRHRVPRLRPAVQNPPDIWAYYGDLGKDQRDL